MRSLLVLVVPALLSFNLLACASDDGSSEPSHDVVTNPLVQEGGECTKNEDCASNLCEFAVAAGGSGSGVASGGVVTGGIQTKGLPAPCTNDTCDPAPAPVPQPAPAPAPLPKGKPGPSPEPPVPARAPVPQPAPAPVGVCATR